MRYRNYWRHLTTPDGHRYTLTHKEIRGRVLLVVIIFIDESKDDNGRHASGQKGKE